MKQIMDSQDWVVFKQKMKQYSIGQKFKIFDNYYNYLYEPREVTYIRLCRKLGYLEKLELSNGGYFLKLKDIPDDLTYNQAVRLTKNSSLSNTKSRFKGSEWDKVVSKINSINDETFNALNIFGITDKHWYYGYTHLGERMIHKNILTYLSNLHGLEYIERIGKNRYGDYKIIKKIPNSLTVNDAHLMLYDKMWKRKRKIDRLKEKYQYNDNK